MFNDPDNFEDYCSGILLLFSHKLCSPFCDFVNCSTPGILALHYCHSSLILLSIEPITSSNHLIFCCSGPRHRSGKSVPSTPRSRPLRSPGPPSYRQSKVPPTSRKALCRRNAEHSAPAQTLKSGQVGSAFSFSGWGAAQ